MSSYAFVASVCTLFSGRIVKSYFIILDRLTRVDHKGTKFYFQRISNLRDRGTISYNLGMKQAKTFYTLFVCIPRVPKMVLTHLAAFPGLPSRFPRTHDEVHGGCCQLCLNLKERKLFLELRDSEPFGMPFDHDQY